MCPVASDVAFWRRSAPRGKVVTHQLHDSFGVARRSTVTSFAIVEWSPALRSVSAFRPRVSPIWKS